MRLNVTAVYTIEQVRDITNAVTEGVPTYVSVFAGRIADTGVDPLPLMKESVEVTHSKKGVKLLWASCREVINVIQADEIGADIITCPADVVKKLIQIWVVILKNSQLTQLKVSLKIFKAQVFLSCKA